MPHSGIRFAGPLIRPGCDAAAPERASAVVSMTRLIFWPICWPICWQVFWSIALVLLLANGLAGRHSNRLNNNNHAAAAAKAEHG